MSYVSAFSIGGFLAAIVAEPGQISLASCTETGHSLHRPTPVEARRWAAELLMAADAAEHRPTQESESA